MEKKSLIFMRCGMVLSVVHINIGRIDLLPDFLGMILFILALHAHEEMTVTEKRAEPFLWILTADFFVKWLTGFSNSIEELLITVISVCVFYVLIGEVMKRIWDSQQDVAETLGLLRIAIVVLLAANFLVGFLAADWLNLALIVAFLLAIIFFFIKTFSIIPLEE